MRFSIKGKMYDAAGIDDLTLIDILTFETQTKAMGVPVEWTQIEQWVTEVDALKTDEEKASHPGTLWTTGVVIWASRKAAGEDLSFGDAMNIRMGDLKFLPEAADHKPVNPTKARTGSGRAAARRNLAVASATTSEPKSANG